MMWTALSFGAAQILCLVLCATTGAAHSLEKRAEDIKQECLQGKLNYPRIEVRTFGITVERIAFTPKKECLEDGANYVINISWKVENEEQRSEDAAVEKDSYEIRDLKPWTAVDILVSLLYIDKKRERHAVNVTDFQTRTSPSTPTVPLNFKASEAAPNLITMVFEPPESPSGALDGYKYEVCKSCVDVIPGYCGGVEKELRPLYDNSFQLTDLAPLEYHTILLRAYNYDYTKNRTFNGDYAKVCIRAPPSDVEVISDLEVTCKSGSSRAITVTWKLPSNSQNVPEGYTLQVDRYPTKAEITSLVSEDQFKTHDVNIRSSCQADACRYDLKQRSGGGLYVIDLTPSYKDVGPLLSFARKGDCYLPPPPPPTEIRVVDDPLLNETQQMIEIPEDLFPEFNISIDRTEWIIAQDTEIDTCFIPPLPWRIVHEHHPIECYVAILLEGDEDMPYCNKSGDVYRCVLGAQEDCPEDSLACNGPLKVGVRYGVKIRAFSKGEFAESKVAFFTAGSPSSTTGAAISVKAGRSTIPIMYIMTATAIVIMGA